MVADGILAMVSVMVVVSVHDGTLMGYWILAESVSQSVDLGDFANVFGGR
jgi:hypothetical protein